MREFIDLKIRNRRKFSPSNVRLVPCDGRASTGTT